VRHAVDLALESALGATGVTSHFQVINVRDADRDTHRLRAAVDSPSHTVLVVDDDAAIRFLCRVNLELDGWAVHEAAAIEQARATLAATLVDIVLLDVHVGVGDGNSGSGEPHYDGKYEQRGHCRIPRGVHGPGDGCEQQPGVGQTSGLLEDCG